MGIKQEQGAETMEPSPTEQWIDSTTTCNRPLTFPTQPDQVYLQNVSNGESQSLVFKFTIRAFLHKAPDPPRPNKS